jgi:hypothetical protein
MNLKYLIVSLISGIAIVAILFFVSEYSDPISKGVKPPELNSDQLREEVNSWSSRRWNKSSYDSLSATLQTTKVVASEKEKENLQLTLDGYYCNSMKLSYQDWISQGCNGNSESPKISDLIVEMNAVVKNGKFRDIDTDPLIPLIDQYSDIRAAAGIPSQVLAHLGKEFDANVNNNLEKRIKDLSSKSHVRSCSQIVNGLGIALGQLSDFDDFQVNFKIKRKMNTKATNTELCEQLRKAFPDVDKYKYYNN